MLRRTGRKAECLTIVLIIIVIILILICAGLASKSRSQVDQKLIQGSQWTADSVKQGGKSISTTISFQFTSDSTVTIVAEGKTHKGNFTINANASPKTIDIVPDQANIEDRSKLTGIYVVDKDGKELVISLTESWWRPKFDSVEGSSNVVLTLHR